jgi:hypothetical protein
MAKIVRRSEPRVKLSRKYRSKYRSSVPLPLKDRIPSSRFLSSVELKGMLSKKSYFSVRLNDDGIALLVHSDCYCVDGLVVFDDYPVVLSLPGSCTASYVNFDRRDNFVYVDFVDAYGVGCHVFIDCLPCAEIPFGLLRESRYGLPQSIS